MSGASTIGAITATCLGSAATEASLKSTVRTLFGSAPWGKGMRLELASDTGTTGEPLTDTDHNRSPLGKLSRRCGLPRFFTKYLASVRTWPSLEIRVVSEARSTTKLSESPCASGLSARRKLKGLAK